MSTNLSVRTLEKRKRKSSFLALSCVELCGYGLRRPHFTCLFCRLRRFERRVHARGLCRADFRVSIVYRRGGRYVLPFDASAYTLVIDNGRRFRRVKAFLLKRLLAVAELLAN